MTQRDAQRRRIPVWVYVSGLVGGSVGAFIGTILCFGYNLVYGPWFPQAGVDPQPAGWEGWWVIGGGAAGASMCLFVVGVIVALKRAANTRPKHTPHDDTADREP